MNSSRNLVDVARALHQEIGKLITPEVYGAERSALVRAKEDAFRIVETLSDVLGESEAVAPGEAGVKENQL